jgi:hypothetical protein
MLKFIGYLTVGFVALVLAVTVLGMLSSTLSSLFYWFNYRGLPGLVTLAAIGLVAYGLWHLVSRPDY